MTIIDVMVIYLLRVLAHSNLWLSKNVTTSHKTTSYDVINHAKALKAHKRVADQLQVYLAMVMSRKRKLQVAAAISKRKQLEEVTIKLHKMHNNKATKIKFW